MLQEQRLVVGSPKGRWAREREAVAGEVLWPGVHLGEVAGRSTGVCVEEQAVMQPPPLPHPPQGEGPS